jgi:hypothetical protein
VNNGSVARDGATNASTSPSTSNTTAPADDGVKLATLDRGPGKELRLRWREFKGHHFLDIREWSKSEQGTEFWPVKGRGISIKSRELAEVIKALEAARGL